ncbi:MAG: glycoside hydrolase family 3 N-terminal domain-containing protein [Flavobacteriales bacterium]
MQKIAFIALTAFSLGCTAQTTNTRVGATKVSDKHTYGLQHFYLNNNGLTEKTNQVYERMTEEERVAQMIIASLGKLGKPYETVEPLIKERRIGGIIFLSGDPNSFHDQIEAINAMSKDWPLIMSMDAEPSLLNRRMPGTPPMKPTAELTSEAEISHAVSTIDSVLHHVGFHQNFAPVIDLSPNNEAIGNRTFGTEISTVVPKAVQFIKETQEDQIVATAKHFPGHGRVAGDTHKQLVYINGELRELETYPPMIEAGVLSVMVGHIAVENNEVYSTNGMPSTLSPVIVKVLLRNELGFDGIIITDAMNMGAVTAIPHSGLLAAKAGCDMILMPPDEKAVMQDILQEMNVDPEFKKQVEESVKRIIRLKLCLGMSFSPT